MTRVATAMIKGKTHHMTAPENDSPPPCQYLGTPERPIGSKVPRPTPTTPADDLGWLEEPRTRALRRA